MQEYRGYNRINLACKIEYVIEENRQFASSRAQNVSEGGICLITDKFLQTGTVLRCKIYLQSEKKPILVVGQIVWIKKKEIGPRAVYDNGIRFIEIRDDDRKKLEGYIHQKKEFSALNVD